MAREAISGYGLVPIREHVPLADHRSQCSSWQDGPAEGDEQAHQGIPHPSELVHRRPRILCQKRSKKRRRVCAVDSTGFSIRRFVRWFDVRHGKRKRRKDFLKLHFIVDCKSLLILSFKVTPPFKSDGRQVEYLLSFVEELGRLCADKAYLSRKTCDLIAKHGGKPYISIKKNVVRIRAQGSKAWREMLVMYRRSKKVYKKRYHRRSLAETAISVVKMRFSHSLNSKKRRGQKNEVRLKVIAYNLTIIARLPETNG
jgi:transposase